MDADRTLRALAEDYLKAFKARDLARCVESYADDASLDFQLGVFRGRDAITEWHRDRFDANFRLLEIERLTVEGDTVVLDAVASSDRLAAWRIPKLGGRLTMRFVGGKIAEGRFVPRGLNPIDLFRSAG